MNEIVADQHLFDVNVQWGPRPESAQALASRWIALIERLQTVDPHLAKWSHWAQGLGFVPFNPQPAAQVARVIDGTTRARDGRVFPGLGASIWNTTDPCPRSKRFTMLMRAGKDHGCNQIIGETDYYVVPDPALVTYDVLRGVMLAAAETFEATQARVYTVDMRRLWTSPRGIGEDLDLAWISYVAPRFAHLVAPPPSVIVEHRPDGGLLMAATAESFSVANASHLAAARAIKSSLGAYNAVPWTPETGK